jgi:REP element-mobilizing transposase RayT
MPGPLAYFLTWSCYGTWLHGDARGSVDADHNECFTPTIDPDPFLKHRVRSLMTDEPFTLAPDARAVVDRTIRRHCEIRKWRILAVNARSTHVHVVVDCCESIAPEPAMEQFKAWCTRKLREAGFARPDQKVWTEHGSTRWIDTERSLAEAIDYVLNRQ